MIYCKDAIFSNVLLNRFILAMEYLEDFDENASFLKESLGYVEADVLFVAQAKLDDELLKHNYLKFHFTDQ